MPSDTIILCGLGRVGWRILEFLQAAGFPVVVIDTHCEEDDERLVGAELIRGDCRRKEVLREAGIEDCRGLLVVTSDDLVNISATLVARSINPEVRIVVRMFNEQMIDRLGHAIHNIFALSTSALTAPLLAVKALTGEALGTFRVEGAVPERRQVSTMTIPFGSHLRGRTVGELAHTYNVQVLAHAPVSGSPGFLMDVKPEDRLSVGDRLTVSGDPHHLRRLLRKGEEDTGEELRWAGWLRRHSRTVRDALSGIDWPVKLILTVLISVAVTGTLVFRHIEGQSWPESVYHTVSIMATMADMREKREELKIFVSVLRFVGAALTAGFTAILANYLLRASLRGALEVRRIPESGHVIVAGLGAIGFRAIEELARAGERVVAIEVSRDNRFLGTVRRQGIPVILGDATVEEVMEQAHGSKAKAVIACTSDDLINLEIALMARQLRAEQRIVVLQSDQYLAELLREGASVRLAVSVPALTAPAFVAGLFGDRVQSVFFLHERLMTVVDIVIQDEEEHLEGQSVRTVAVDHRLLPIAVVPGDGSPPSRNPMNARLRTGDRLVAVISLPDLEQLLRRQPVPKEWAVDVTAFPLAAREWLTLIVQRSQNVSTEEAGEALENLPMCLEDNLTRGQADDLIALLRRERVEVELRTMPTEDERPAESAKA